MDLILADPAKTLLHRIGRFPDPLAWPPPGFRGSGRFDDPRDDFGVIYAAAFRIACYLETLDTYRPDRALLQRLTAMGSEPFIPQSGMIPDDYFTKLIGRFRLDDGQAWLDLRINAEQTAVALSREPAIAAVLPALGYGKRFKLGDRLGSDRQLTQTVARWAYANGYAGLACSCSHRPRLDCWAIFEGAGITIVDTPTPIRARRSRSDRGGREFGLTIFFDRA